MTTTKLDFSEFKCSICLEWLSSPVILNCDHRFCLKCIETMTTKMGPWLTCPLCRIRFNSIKLKVSIQLERSVQEVVTLMSYCPNDRLYPLRDLITQALSGNKAGCNCAGACQCPNQDASYNDSLKCNDSTKKDEALQATAWIYCPPCQTVIGCTTLDDFVEHYDTYHRGKNPLWDCVLCSEKSFPSENGLKDHLGNIHVDLFNLK